MTEKLSLNQKLFAIQSEIGAVKKDANNPYFKSKYASLSAVNDALGPLLEKYKLVIKPKTSAQGLDTEIADIESSESFATHIPFIDATDMQKLGAAITYARRYSLLTIFNLDTEDDDGNGTITAKPPKKFGSILPEQVVDLLSLGVDFEKLAKYCRLESWLQLSEEQAQKAINAKQGVDNA